MAAALLIASVLAFTPADAETAHAAAAGLVAACTPRDAGTPGALRAADWIAGWARKTGARVTCDSFRAPTPDGTCQFRNVLAEFPAEDANAPWIAFVSHFDTTPNGGVGFQGANDGASTSGLMLALAAVAARAGGPRNCGLLFLWTDGEECRRAYGPNDGLQGARRAVARFRATGRRVRAVIGLDMLGDRDLAIEIPANGTESLKIAALAAAKRIGEERCLVRGRRAVLDDFSVFLDAGYPAIDLIDFSYGSRPGANDYWHTPADSMDKVSSRSLLVAGRLAVALVGELDGLAENAPGRSTLTTR